MQFRGDLARGVLLVVACVAGVKARELRVEFSGRASGWLGASRDTSFLGRAGLRCTPAFDVSMPAHFDAELSANGYAAVQARRFDNLETDARVRPYRLWLRYSPARFEARAGLQKINFGSATLLRPLQWFDRVDPRDPLALTDGVYGLLARYYFQNNTNVWAWGLLGNSSPKGWEAIGSERWAPEPGGRVQVPVPRGEVAATYHHRRAELLASPPASVDEDRVGLDGKWDAGIGCLFEAALVRQVTRAADTTDTWQRMATIGLDYTFGIGHGLGVAAEQMLAGGADEPFGRGADTHLSALMLGLPLGLLDNLKGIVYYDWSDKGVYRFLGWQRTLDNWLFSVTAFWNPDKAQVAAAGPMAGFAGVGVQLMVVFNH